MMKNKLFKIVLLFLAVFALPHGIMKGQSFHEIGKPFINYFSPKDYKSGPLNWCIAQDKKGIMFFGNESGLLEYDGHYWRKIKVPGNESVRSIAADKNGTIYVCAGSDFGFLQPDSIGVLKYKSLLPYLNKKYRNFAEIWDVATSSESVFFKTEDEIFRWNGKNITVLDSVPAFRLYCIDDTIYSRSGGTGLMKIIGDSIKLMPDGGFFSSTGVFNMLSYEKDSSGKTSSILVTTNEQGLFIQRNNKFKPFKTDADLYLKNKQIYNAVITSTGNIAIATQRGGVVILDHNGKLIKIINEESGLPTNIIYDIYADKNGGLWLATGNGIVYCKEQSPLSIFQNSGKLKKRLYAVIRHKGIIYAANDLGVLYLKNNKSGFQLVNGSNKPAYAFLNAGGTLLAGTNYALVQIENFSLKKYILNEVAVSLINSKVFPGRIYSTTSYGFAAIQKHHDGNFVVTYKKQFGYETASIVEDSDGSLWIGGYFPGIYHVTGNLSELAEGSDKNIKYQFYDKKNGLPGTNWSLYEVNNKLLVTTDKGIYSFDKKNNKFIHDFTLGKTLSDSTASVSLITKSQNHGLWILADINDSYSLGKALLKKDGTYEWKPIPVFKRLDLGYLTSMYSDVDKHSGLEKLWICTNDGLVLFNPMIKSNIPSEYSSLIRKVSVNGDSVIYGGAETSDSFKRNIELPFSKNNVSFEFSALTYDKPNSTVFQCFLEGEEKGWSKWAPETIKEYTNLAQGDYIFHVRAKNIYGVMSDESVFKFSVLAPWYFTWWAYVFYFLVIGGILYSIRKFELNRREKNNQIKLNQLRAEAAESKSKLIQADNERKSKELEEARKLQLSMLPQNVPQVPHLDIAVFMQTATEVGGDYYDFSIADGTLNIVLGDATGHGMQAGTLVTIMKGIFTLEAGKSEVIPFFNKSAEAIKEIKLGRLMMAFVFLKIKNSQLSLSNAGLPPVYIYRKYKNEVEEIDNKGMPLGAMSNFPYKETKTELNKGDVIYLLSDGFPELSNDEKEMYGYERVRKIFKEAADNSAEEIIEKLKNAVNEWSAGKVPEDDVTFVVLKVI